MNGEYPPRGGDCRDKDPELFFPSKGGNSGIRAKAVCAECPVRAACLAYALEWRVEGIWGGTSFRQRERMRARLKIRPKQMALPDALIDRWRGGVDDVSLRQRLQQRRVRVA